MQTTSVNLDLFEKACGFTFTIRRWGNERQGNVKTLLDKAAQANAQQDQTEPTGDSKKLPNQNRVKLKKTLLDSPEYDAIVKEQNALRTWVETWSVPSFFKSGLAFVNLADVERFEDKFNETLLRINAELVPAFVTAYPAQVQKARAELGDQFNVADYPATDALADQFTIEWNFIAFAVPDKLPPELRQQEEEKLQKTFADAGEQITAALREGFKKLVEHAANSLKVQPGDKQKTFRDTLVGNIQEFIATFNSRNITNDIELAALVQQAKKILTGIGGETKDTAQKLRESNNLRETTAKAFAEINQSLSGMVTEKKTRVFQFDDEETPTAPAQPETISSPPAEETAAEPSLI